ncbi:MAG: glutamine synthetase type III, partial [Bacteroidaceae bacterium]|nr:glutamine synthetase type III [Bacteroidaceae bacterium]
HNEVAPNQYELAPIFEETNLAIDHNMLIMSLMKRTARKHGFRCLLHEKPFAGINGSGKHNNWSLATDTGILLHGPGKTPLDNLRFVTFIVESLMAVHRHNGLLKASIISATNVHRLGAAEAPPAIVSSFLGKQLSDLLEHLETCTDDELISLTGKQALCLDIPQIPELMQDDTDRNRTSPFAFTGNRFEFRAVGSQQNCAAAMIVINTAMAEALTNFKVRVDALIAEGVEPMKAILRIVREDIKTCKPIHFDGNGYSDAWKQEAARRGLDVETCAPIILDQYLAPATVEMFSKMNVLTKAELQARNEIKLDTYIKKIQIEARILGDICMNHIIPVATRYQTQLIDNVHKMAGIFPAETAERLNGTNMSLIKQIGEHNTFVIENVERLIEARRVANRIKNDRERAIAYHDTVAPLIEEIRYHVDQLELIVDDELWPLPKYREMLFIH